MSDGPCRGVLAEDEVVQGGEVAFLQFREPDERELQEGGARAGQVGRGAGGEPGGLVDGAVGEAAHAAFGEQGDGGFGDEFRTAGDHPWILPA
ncbi:hypothetical protein [Actinomadura sp. J1-007]|uniref:hypothetical protein n=1 Tax=Actinomadura sp. J1-007 TaxID=2661913 RepID=UPI001369E334|nr:hypothetical protein [Actinomadura sp. J1-007]